MVSNQDRDRVTKGIFGGSDISRCKRVRPLETVDSLFRQLKGACGILYTAVVVVVLWRVLKPF